MHCNKRPFYLKGKEDDSSIMDAYIMHAVWRHLWHLFHSAFVLISYEINFSSFLTNIGWSFIQLNHIHSIRENVLKNDAKLNKDENSKSEEIHCGEFYLDQGFTRPKVRVDIFFFLFLQITCVNVLFTFGSLIPSKLKTFNSFLPLKQKAFSPVKTSTMVNNSYMLEHSFCSPKLHLIKPK